MSPAGADLMDAILVVVVLLLSSSFICYNSTQNPLKSHGSTWQCILIIQIRSPSGKKEPKVIPTSKKNAWGILVQLDQRIWCEATLKKRLFPVQRGGRKFSFFFSFFFLFFVGKKSIEIFGNLKKKKKKKKYCLGDCFHYGICGRSLLEVVNLLDYAPLGLS